MSKHLLLDQKHPPYQPAPAPPELALDLIDIQLLRECVNHTYESSRLLAGDAPQMYALGLEAEDVEEAASRFAYLLLKLEAILADYVNCAQAARGRATAPSIVTARN